MHQPVDGLNLSTNVELLSAVPQDLNPWVLLVTTKDLLGLLVLVRPVHIVDGDNGEVAVVTEVAESNASGGLDAELVDGGLGDVEADGHREEVAIGQAVVGNDTGRCISTMRKS
jgi:hypothetical protein